jgi:hypothetical protein
VRAELGIAAFEPATSATCSATFDVGQTDAGVETGKNQFVPIAPNHAAKLAMAGQ